MTRDEVLVAIQNAQRAIRQYRAENLGTGQSEPERAKIEEIKKSTRSLWTEAKDAYLMGPSGGQCGCCNGTGRG